MVEERIIGGICYSVNRYAKVKNKCMKNFDKHRNFSYQKKYFGKMACK